MNVNCMTRLLRAATQRKLHMCTALTGNTPAYHPPACLLAALLQQVMSLTPQQIELLPPQQKAQVLALQQQLGHR